MAWLRHLYTVSCQRAAEQHLKLPDFEDFWARGHLKLSPPATPRVALDTFRADPEAHPLTTPSGRIEIFSETIDGFGYDDCPGHPTWLEPCEWLGAEKAAQYPLAFDLESARHPSAHSHLDNGVYSRERKVAGREPVAIHPGDAAARGIKDRDVVRLFNDRGACLAGAVVTEAVRPGVVQLSTGAWYDPLDPGKPSSLDKHGNPNLLTLDKAPRLSQGPSVQSALVECERYEGELPPVTAFSAPPARAASG